MAISAYHHQSSLHLWGHNEFLLSFFRLPNTSNETEHIYAEIGQNGTQRRSIDRSSKHIYTIPDDYRSYHDYATIQSSQMPKEHRMSDVQNPRHNIYAIPDDYRSHHGYAKIRAQMSKEYRVPDVQNPRQNIYAIPNDYRSHHEYAKIRTTQM